MFSNNDSYIDNTFTDNGAGVAVMFSNHISMFRNLFSMNRGASAYGLLLKEISDGAIKDNIFENNTTGVLMEGTNRLHIIKIISLKMGMPCVYKQVVATTPFMTITLIATLLMLQPMAHWF